MQAAEERYFGVNHVVRSWFSADTALFYTFTPARLADWQGSVMGMNKNRGSGGKNYSWPERFFQAWPQDLTFYGSGKRRAHIGGFVGVRMAPASNTPPAVVNVATGGCHLIVQIGFTVGIVRFWSGINAWYISAFGLFNGSWYLGFKQRREKFATVSISRF